MSEEEAESLIWLLQKLNLLAKEPRESDHKKALDCVKVLTRMQDHLFDMHTYIHDMEEYLHQVDEDEDKALEEIAAVTKEITGKYGPN